MIFDTNVLIYATVTGADQRARRARHLSARAMMQAANSVLLLRSLAEFSNVVAEERGDLLSSSPPTLERQLDLTKPQNIWPLNTIQRNVKRARRGN